MTDPHRPTGFTAVTSSRKEAVWLVAIGAAAIAMKVLLLVTSQKALDGDEAIVGLMALHVQHGVSHPLFFYGQSYDAGAGLFAHAAALAFVTGGVSGTTLKALALVVWIGMALVAGGILRRWIGRRAAGLGIVLILWAPTSVEWGMKARGGYMIAAILALATLAFALSGRSLEKGTPRALANALAIGACAAAAAWAHPTTLPVVGALCLWVIVEWLQHRDLGRPTALLAAAAVLSAIPVLVATAAGSAWAWQTFAGTQAHRAPGALVFSILPAFFTPELDRAYPPAPWTVQAVGYLWLLAVVAAAAVIALVRKGARDSLKRPAALLLVCLGTAPLAFFLVGSTYARPRHILVLYPFACIAVAAVTEFARRRTIAAWPVLPAGALLLSGMVVHAESLGPATIHGAGEQELRQPAALIDRMVTDLDRHGVRCVFSESPMLQWNLAFASRERIAARWITAEDRWPPYVERVNRAFATGEPCALLLMDAPGRDRIAGFRARLGADSDRMTIFNAQYALVYDVPPNIREIFR